MRHQGGGSYRKTGVAEGRWQPYGVTNTVTLKRKVNPVAMCVKWTKSQNMLPAMEILYGYDMSMADWVIPFGKGKVADFFVKYERNEGAKRLEINSVLTLVFTNALDGAYRMKKDISGSSMNTAYCANTNAAYNKEIAFIYDRTTDKINKDTFMSNDDYLVLRTRGELDEKGKLRTAHYSKIVGKFEVARGNRLDFVFYFNPSENDPNLEADTTKNLLNPRDLGFSP